MQSIPRTNHRDECRQASQTLFAEASRKAITRLGATQDGVLRNHMVMRDGRVRDSVMYSIIREEWPQVKQRLMAKLNA